MKYYIKSAILASIKKAINYVLRLRMTKVAEVKGYKPKLYKNIESYRNSGLPFNTGDSIKLPQGTTLFNKVGPLYPTDTKFNELLDTHQYIFNIAPDFELPAGSKTTLEFGGASDEGGAYNPLNGDISYNWNYEAPIKSTVGHEHPHKNSQTAGKRDVPVEEAFSGGAPWNIIGGRGNKRVYGDNFPIYTHLYNADLPTTSSEFGVQLLPLLTRIYNNQGNSLEGLLPDSYNKDTLGKGLSYKRLIQSMPYMRLMPRVSPFGIDHTITPEEFASYTIPGKYDRNTNTFQEDRYPLGTKQERESDQLFNRVNNYSNGGGNAPEYLKLYKAPTDNEFFNYITNLPIFKQKREKSLKNEKNTYRNFIPNIIATKMRIERIKNTEPEEAKELQKIVDNAIKDIPIVNRRRAEMNAGDLSNTNTAFNYDYMDGDAWIPTIPQKQYLWGYEQKPFTGTGSKKDIAKQIESQATDQIAKYLFNLSNPEEKLKKLYPELDPDPKDHSDFVEANRAMAKAILGRLAELKEQDRKDNEYYYKVEIPQWIIRHAMRGVNVVNGKLVPFAPLQGISQRISPKTKKEWAQLHGQVMQRLNQYKSNPRYLNVMKKWELSPFGEDMLGFNKPMLTIEQMRQILEDLNQEDRNYEIENSPQFQGYGYDTMA